MFVMKSLPILLIANFIYGCVVVVSSANFGTSRSSPSSSSSAKLQMDRALPPLVPPKLVEDDDDFDERDLDLSAADHHGLQLRPPYWAPTLETLAPEEAEFYRKALVSAMIGSRPAVAAAAAVHEMKRGAEAGHRSMSMLRMGRGSSGVRRRSAAMGSDGVRRSMTMLRMGRGFDEEEGEDEEEAVKRTMGMLRMGRGANGEEDFRKSMSMLRMGRGAMLNENEDDEESEDQQQQQLKRSMGMLRMGRRNVGSSSSSDDGDALDGYEDGEDGESKRSMGMLRMGRAMASKNVDRGALNMLRMGKREIISSSSHHQLTGSASSADKSSSSSN